MPTEIQTPTPWAKLADAFRLTGRHRLLIDEVIVPVVVVSDLSEVAATTEQEATAYFSMVAIVGSATVAVLFNGVTADTGVDLIIDSALASSETAGTYRVRQTTVAPVAPAAGVLLTKNWNRFPQVGVPPGTQFANTALLAGQTLYRVPVLANSPLEIDLGITLGAFQALALDYDGVNEAWRTTWRYRVVKRA